MKKKESPMDHSNSERAIVMACSAFQAIFFALILTLVISTTTEDNGFIIVSSIAMIFAFLTTTAVGCAGGNQSVLKFSRYMLWLPGFALVVLFVIGMINE